MCWCPTLNGELKLSEMDSGFKVSTLKYIAHSYKRSLPARSSNNMTCEISIFTRVFWIVHVQFYVSLSFESLDPHHHVIISNTILARRPYHHCVCVCKCVFLNESNELRLTLSLSLLIERNPWLSKFQQVSNHFSGVFTKKYQFSSVKMK